MIKIREISFQDISYLIIFGMLVAYLILSASVSAQPEYEQLLEVEVLSGDTLWSIASKHTEGMSVHSYITVVKRENNLSTDHIYPGQILRVPQLKLKEESVANEGDYLLSSKH